MSGGEIDHKPEEIDEKQLIPRMTLNDNKAGMQGVDKEKINKYVHYWYVFLHRLNSIIWPTMLAQSPL